jgi:hypothetical protein
VAPSTNLEEVEEDEEGEKQGTLQNDLVCFSIVSISKTWAYVFERLFNIDLSWLSLYYVRVDEVLLIGINGGH